MEHTTDWENTVRREMLEDWDVDGTIVWKLKRGLTPEMVVLVIKGILSEERERFAKMVESFRYNDEDHLHHAPIDDVLALLTKDTD